jgi:hypothetical protein
MRRWAIPLLLLGPLVAAVLPLAVRRGWLPTTMLLGVSLGIVMVTVIWSLWLALAGHLGRRGNQSLAGPALYQDRMILITADRLVLRRYSPLGSSRTVPFADIEVIRALPPTLRNGKWRLSGTGDFRRFFTRDFRRPWRDTIFLLIPHDKAAYQIGFTVEDSAQVRKVLSQIGVLQPVCLKCGYDLRGSEGPCPECGAPRATSPSTT